MLWEWARGQSAFGPEVGQGDRVFVKVTGAVSQVSWND